MCLNRLAGLWVAFTVQSHCLERTARRCPQYNIYLKLLKQLFYAYGGSETFHCMYSYFLCVRKLNKKKLMM